MLLLLPDFVLDELVSLLTDKERRLYRLISKKMDLAILPFLLLSFKLNCRGFQRYEESIVKKLGKYTQIIYVPNFLDLDPLFIEEARNSIQPFFPNINTIDFEYLISYNVVGFAKLFTKLKSACFNKYASLHNILELSPLLENLSFLRIGDSWVQFHSLAKIVESVRALERFSFKKLEFPSCYGLEFFDIAADLLTGTTILEGYPKYSQDPSFVYNRVKGGFSKIKINNARFSLSINFEPKESQTDQKNSNTPPSKTIEDLDSFFGLGHASFSGIKGLRQRIKKLDFEANSKFVPDKEITPLLKAFVQLEDFRFVTDSPLLSLSLPVVTFDARYVSMSIHAASHLAWIENCFPKLSLLRLEAFFNEDQFDDIKKLHLSSLISLESTHDQYPDFWRIVISVCPKLRCVSYRRSQPDIEILCKEFPNILFLASFG